MVHSDEVHSDEVHTFFPVTLYVCTLSHGCFADIESAEDSSVVQSVMGIHSACVNLTTAQHLTLNSSSLSYIETLVGTSLPTHSGATVTIADEATSNSSPSSNSEYWTNIGGITLTRKHRHQIINGKELCDLHVNAFQNLLKLQFPCLGGLQNTLLQKRSPLKCTEGGMSLQIIHTRSSHWAALQICDSNVCLYDSAYTSTSSDTLEVIAQLVHSKEQSIEIQMMNITQQTGTTDCALYAMSTITCLALGIDPVTIILNKDELRPHLVKSLETRTISLFPVKKH